MTSADRQWLVLDKIMTSRHNALCCGEALPASTVKHFAEENEVAKDIIALQQDIKTAAARSRKVEDRLKAQVGFWNVNVKYANDCLIHLKRFLAGKDSRILEDGKGKDATTKPSPVKAPKSMKNVQIQADSAGNDEDIRSNPPHLAQPDDSQMADKAEKPAQSFTR